MWKEERLAYMFHRAVTRVPTYRELWAARLELHLICGGPLGPSLHGMVFIYSKRVYDVCMDYGCI